MEEEEEKEKKLKGNKKEWKLVFVECKTRPFRDDAVIF